MYLLRRRGYGGLSQTNDSSPVQLPVVAKLRENSAVHAMISGVPRRGKAAADPLIFCNESSSVKTESA